MKPTKRSRARVTTAFVPRVVFATAFVGVVPACAGSHEPQPSVAATAYATTPPSGGASDTTDAASPPVRSETIVLAYVAFDAGAQATDVDAASPDDASTTVATDAGRAHGRRHH